MPYEYIAPDQSGNNEFDMDKLFDAFADWAKQLNYDIGLLGSQEQNGGKKDIFPVGYVLIQADDTDPNKYFYGRWQRIAAGKCLVGKDADDPFFDETGKTGGSKYMQEHTHDIMCNNLPLGEEYAGGTAGYSLPSYVIDSAKQVTIQTSGTGTSGNLQPYLVVNFWQRME